MEIKVVNLVYFSATNVSKKYAQAMGKSLEKEIVEYDITLPINRNPSIAPRFTKDELVILSLPIYGGRVPTICLDYINAMKGENTPCVIVGTYGNRHYDDALVEMEDIVSEQGFIVIGAAALIGRHSFSDEIAGDRPNEKDLEEAANFIKEVVKKECKPLEKGTIPGNRPYKERGGTMPLGPSTTEECIDCKICAKKCPNGVISVENPKELVKEATECLRCHSCVVKCPKQAKYFDGDSYKAMVERCIEGFGKLHKENLYYI